MNDWENTIIDIIILPSEVNAKLILEIITTTSI
jgi:hypothetical protein